MTIQHDRNQRKERIMEMRKVLEVRVNEENSKQLSLFDDFRSEEELENTMRLLILDMADRGTPVNDMMKFVWDTYHNASSIRDDDSMAAC